MLFSELYKSPANVVTFVGFRGGRTVQSPLPRSTPVPAITSSTDGLFQPATDLKFPHAVLNAWNCSAA